MNSSEELVSPVAVGSGASGSGFTRSKYTPPVGSQVRFSTCGTVATVTGHTARGFTYKDGPCSQSRTFWLRGLCAFCAPLRGMQRRFDVPPARAFSHKRYICVECGSACCGEPIEAYEPVPNSKDEPGPAAPGRSL